MIMRRLSRKDHIRRQVIRDWRGADDPLDLNQNVSLAAMHIAAIMRQVGLTEGMEEAKLKQIWQQVAGDFIAKASVPDSLKRGCLTIRVTQPAMRFHLEQMRGSLLAKVQQAAGNQMIQSLRFTVG
jgi:predicted nucleic acid-binding Zn ribbon protein